MTAKELRRAWMNWITNNYDEYETIGAIFCEKAVPDFRAAQMWISEVIAEKISQPFADVFANIDTINA